MGIPIVPPRFDTDHMRPFYEGLAANELRLTACAACGRILWYPPEVAPCHPDAAIGWRRVSALGRVHMFSTVHRSLLPGDNRAAVPYTVALIEPDDAPGARVPGLLVELGDVAPACDMRVRLHPVAAGDFTIAGFVPAA
jgi:uncharacterized OB-fold protein